MGEICLVSNLRHPVSYLYNTVTLGVKSTRLVQMKPICAIHEDVRGHDGCMIPVSSQAVLWGRDPPPDAISRTLAARPL
jgi:hypothetical protein